MTEKELLERYKKGKRVFSRANLHGAKLNGANLSGADLSRANLSWAKLHVANLRGADLSRANLSEANISGTYIDPMAPIPLTDLSNFTEHDGEYVIGFRTKKSVHCGETEYIPGECYSAPFFSVDTDTECHPGIYLSPSIENLNDNEYTKYCHNIVKVKALKSETIKACGKYRAKRIWVLEDVK